MRFTYKLFLLNGKYEEDQLRVLDPIRLINKLTGWVTHGHACLILTCKHL